MTLIVGVDYGSEILVMADTRVSFGTGVNVPPPEDRIIKLVTIRFLEREAVLGFSGNVEVVRDIVEFIRTKAKYTRSSGILKEDLKKWIEEISQLKQREEYPTFMLCDLDPSAEEHIHVYKTEKPGEVQVQPPERVNIRIQGGHLGLGRVSIIGSGKKYERRIYEAVLMSFGNPEQYVDYDAFSTVRALMAESIVQSWFEDIDSQDVGGPFTTMRVRPGGIIGPHYLWPTQTYSPNVTGTRDGTKIILNNPSTGEKYTLFSIFDGSNANPANRRDACVCAY